MKRRPPARAGTAGSLARQGWSGGLDARLRRIRLVALDVDGVLTDGAVYWGVVGDGKAGRGKQGLFTARRFNVKDGMGIALLRRAGFKVAWISSAGNASVAERGKGLGVDRVCLRVEDKQTAWENLKQEFGLRDDQILFMGDDVNDLPCLRRAGVAAAPADAVREVRRRAHYVTKARGGEGAVREVAELLLSSRASARPVSRTGFSFPA